MANEFDQKEYNRTYWKHYEEPFTTAYHAFTNYVTYMTYRDFFMGGTPEDDNEFKKQYGTNKNFKAKKYVLQYFKKYPGRCKVELDGGKERVDAIDWKQLDGFINDDFKKHPERCKVELDSQNYFTPLETMNEALRRGAALGPEPTTID